MWVKIVQGWLYHMAMPNAIFLVVYHILSKLKKKN